MDFISSLVDQTMMEHGASIDVIKARGGNIRSVVRSHPRKLVSQNVYNMRWTKEEDAFINANFGILTMKQIGEHIGRSENAIKIRQFRKGFNPATKQPGWLTAHQVCILLGVDSHTVPGWIRNGIMPGEYIATSHESQQTLRIKIDDLKFWLTRPKNFPYVRVERMKPGYFRRLVEKAHKRWGDEWINMRQFADMHGLKCTRLLSKKMLLGQLPGVHIRHLGGRDNGYWAYWFIQRSFAEKWTRPKLTDIRVAWITPAADAFMLKMHAEGLTVPEIARMMKQKAKTVDYRIRKLKGVDQSLAKSQRAQRKT
jgi:hypothetical protein